MYGSALRPAKVCDPHNTDLSPQPERSRIGWSAAHAVCAFLVFNFVCHHIVPAIGSSLCLFWTNRLHI